VFVSYNSNNYTDDKLWVSADGFPENVKVMLAGIFHKILPHSTPYPDFVHQTGDTRIGNN
jgi:hypothetical protein